MNTTTDASIDGSNFNFCQYFLFGFCPFRKCPSAEDDGGGPAIDGSDLNLVIGGFGMTFCEEVVSTDSMTFCEEVVSTDSLATKAPTAVDSVGDDTGGAYDAYLGGDPSSGATTDASIEEGYLVPDGPAINDSDVLVVIEGVTFMRVMVRKFSGFDS
jgi:hypothetical protein